MTVLPEHLCRLQSVFDRKHRVSQGLIPRGVGSFGQPWCDRFDALLGALFPDDASLEAAARGYTAFAMDSMRRQRAFEKSLAYPNKSYAEAAVEVYFNDSHMREEYLPGLLLSHFLWPHHYRQLKFFDTAFVAPMARRGSSSFAEVGIGTAVYSARVLDRIPNVTGEGFDISPSSCAFAEHHLQCLGLDQRYRVHRQDVAAQPIEPVAELVCVEVLEHLEDPTAFLRTLRAALAPGGRAFITAALNAAHSDHIYLYRSPDEVQRQLETAGFALEQSFTGAAYAPPAAGVPVPLAAAFVVF